MKLSQEDYVAKITSASALQLVIITYELTLERIGDAVKCHGSNKSEFIANVENARGLLGTLIDALDLSLDIGKQLMLTYIRINKLLIDAKQRNDAEPLGTAAKMLETILEGWREIEKDDISKPVMANAQQVYAGLTYGKEGLTEYVPEESSRGYKA